MKLNHPKHEQLPFHCKQGVHSEQFLCSSPPGYFILLMYLCICTVHLNIPRLVRWNGAACLAVDTWRFTRSSDCVIEGIAFNRLYGLRQCELSPIHDSKLRKVRNKPRKAYTCNFHRACVLTLYQDSSFSSFLLALQDGTTNGIY